MSKTKITWETKAGIGLGLFVLLVIWHPVVAAIVVGSLVLGAGLIIKKLLGA